MDNSNTENPNQPDAQKTVFIKDLRANDKVRTSFLVQSKQLMQARNGHVYLNLTLADSTGSIDTRVWKDAQDLAGRFEVGDVVAVWGKTHLFQNRLQLVVEDMVTLSREEANPSDYLPRAERDVEAMYAELLERFRGLENPWVRQLSVSLLEDPEIARRYKLCPAAKTIHHAYIGGLLTHSLQLMNVAEALLPLYPVLDRSLCLFGAAFHDFGKIYELSYEDALGYTDEGRLVGHIAIGVSLVDRKIREIPDFPPALEYQVKHLILAHHGRLDYGSPKRPATLEAQFVHSIDDMDSKLESIEGLMRAEDSGERWTGHHRAYDQYYYKPDSLMRDPKDLG